MTIILNGSDVAAKIRESLMNSTYASKTLGIIRVGNNPGDLSYERGITKRFGELHIPVKIFAYPESISQEDFNDEFTKINNDENINGILLFRPLPKNLTDEHARRTINPTKDIDCMGYVNTAKLFNGEKNSIAPCTPQAVIEILGHYKFNMAGKNIVIVNRSMVLGRPLAMLMLSHDATVTICHSKTSCLPEICRNADILIVATGHAGLITPEFVSDKSIVIDVGINTNSLGKLCGDVDFVNVSEIVRAITPVPGGVGAVTTLMLAKNLLRS